MACVTDGDLRRADEAIGQTVIIALGLLSLDEGHDGGI